MVSWIGCGGFEVSGEVIRFGFCLCLGSSGLAMARSCLDQGQLGVYIS